MRLLVGWYNPRTGQLVDIPGFDHVERFVEWLPVTVDVESSHEALTEGPMVWLCACGLPFYTAEAHRAHKENPDG